MENPFVHLELNTRDLGTSKKFYAGLFDWKLEEMTGAGTIRSSMSGRERGEA